MGKNKLILNRVFCAALCICLIPGCSFREPIVGAASRLSDNAGAYAMPKDAWYELRLDMRDGANKGFARANGMTRDANGEKPRFTAYLSDNSGLMTPDGDLIPAEVQIKGNNLYRHNYRSFKITLLSEKRWQGQRIFTLYKCPVDSTKIAMRLGLDAYAMFGDIVSVSAGFVGLALRDSPSGDGEYENYGLYTQTEHLGGRYLRSHGLDRNGLLYEAKDFGFEYEAWMAMGEAQRRASLEQNNSEGYEKLENMLLELSVAEDFDSFFERYFDMDNYLTWLGGAILLGNTRASRDTYQLYSPSDSDKWYFLPAPTDALLREPHERKASDPPDSYYGTGMLYDNVLHARFMQSVKNREALDKKTKELREIFSDAAIISLCGSYKKVLADFVGRNPDYGMLRYAPQATEERINRIPAQIAAYQKLFAENLNRPTPFQIYLPVYDNDAWVLSWEDASRDGEQLTYTLTLTSDPEGKLVLYSAETADTSLITELKPQGIAYLHLSVENQNGVGQVAASSTRTGSGDVIWGVTKLVFTDREVTRE